MPISSEISKTQIWKLNLQFGQIKSIFADFAGDCFKDNSVIFNQETDFLIVQKKYLKNRFKITNETKLANILGHCNLAEMLDHLDKIS